MPLFRTGFGQKSIVLFPLFLLLGLTYHNVLYDTSGRGGVKEAVQDYCGTVKKDLSTLRRIDEELA